MSRRYNLFDDRLKIDIPDIFKETTREEAKLFFRDNIPDIVFAADGGRAIFSASLLDIEIKEENVEKRIYEYAQIYNRGCANFNNCSVAKKEMNDGKPIAMFIFTSTTVERDLLTGVALASLNGREFTCEMHCDLQRADKYLPQFMRALNSIRIYDDKPEEAETPEDADTIEDQTAGGK